MNSFLPSQSYLVILWCLPKHLWRHLPLWSYVIQWSRVKLWKRISCLIIFLEFFESHNKPILFFSLNHTMSSTVIRVDNRLLIFIYCRNLCPGCFKENSSSCFSFLRAMNFQLRDRMFGVTFHVDSLRSNSICPVIWLRTEADDFVLHFNGQIVIQFTCLWHLVFTVLLFAWNRLIEIRARGSLDRLILSSSKVLTWSKLIF